MGNELNIEELELSDAELMEILKNHGIDRRSLLKVMGAGAGIAALSGTTAGQEGRGNRIDKIYGATYAANVHTVPSGLVDHVSELHIHPGDATHEGFPAPDGDDPDDQDDAPETFFDPVGIHAKPGDVIEFTTHGDGLHTVTAFDPKFNEPPFLTLPDRVPTDYGFTSPPIAEDDSWLYKFTEKGVYDLFCLPHVSLGMVMRVLVFDPEDDDLSDSTFDEPTPDPNAPLPPNAAAVLNDHVLDPSNIVSQGEVAWSDLTLP
jgi:plastocyanin